MSQKRPTSQKDGTALLKELPAEITMRVWQPSMGEPEAATVRRVTIGRFGLNELE
jgi:hypothetical protein